MFQPPSFLDMDPPKKRGITANGQHICNADQCVMCSMPHFTCPLHPRGEPQHMKAAVAAGAAARTAAAKDAVGIVTEYSQQHPGGAVAAAVAAAQTENRQQDEEDRRGRADGANEAKKLRTEGEFAAIRKRPASRWRIRIVPTEYLQHRAAPTPRQRKRKRPSQAQALAPMCRITRKTSPSDIVWSRGPRVTTRINRVQCGWCESFSSSTRSKVAEHVANCHMAGGCGMDPEETESDG